MLKSMTAYGRGSHASSLGTIFIEIQSVNRKFLDIQFFSTPEFSSFEMEIRKLISEKLSRGQITVKISGDFQKTSPLNVTPNVALAHQLLNAWKTIETALKLDKQPGSFQELLFNQPNIFTIQANPESQHSYQAAVVEALQQALQHLIEMREVEGKHLADDIRKRLISLKKSIDFIAEKSKDSPTKYYHKLKERLDELFSGSNPENEEKILREVAVYAERVDISEEITRFNSHLSQFNTLIASHESVGRTMDFLIQELMRETNTIGSKSADIEVIKQVLDIKTEIERIREQIQNIE